MTTPKMTPFCPIHGRGHHATDACYAELANVQLKADLRLVGLAATAFLHWRDTGSFPALMSNEIDGDALARAIDRIAGVS